MLFLKEEIVLAGADFTSEKFLIGSNHASVVNGSNIPTINVPTQNVAVHGATSDATVTLQVALLKTDSNNQFIDPLDADFFTMNDPAGNPVVFTSNKVVTLPSLNGLWVRFFVDNTGGSDATISAQIY